MHNVINFTDLCSDVQIMEPDVSTIPFTLNVYCICEFRVTNSVQMP